MPIEATSQHLRNAHELLLLVPLRTGFVQTSERLVSYPSRLRSVLSLLFRPTQSSAERTLMPSSSFIDALQNIYHFHYGVVEHLQRPHLILSATFDSSWESYFHNLVDNVGPFLDAIFSHCEGFKDRSCKEGYEAFASFVREHQVQSGIFYSAQPDLTVDDIRILRKVARGLPLEEPIESAESESAKEIPAWEARNDKLRQPDGEFKRSRERDLQRLILAMWDLRALFPADEYDLPKRSAESIFDAAAKQLIKAFMKANAEAELSPTTPDDEVNKWFMKLAQAPGEPPPDWKLATLPPKDLQKIQGNILAPFADRHINLGLMVLLQLPPLEAHRKDFVKKLKELVTTADAQHPPAKGAVCVNVAFTLGGMRRLGLSDEVLDQFPKEFREGMEARSGVLGDFGYPNHPSYWPDLTLSGLQGRGDPDTAKFRLPEVDLVLVLQGTIDAVENDHLWSEAHPLSDVLRKALAKFEGTAPVVLRVEPLRLGKDHFGLFDPDVGESQPKPRLAIEGVDPGPKKPGEREYDNTIALGELLLGHKDKRDRVARCATKKHNPKSHELFKDGSFLVVRKLKQDCAAFDAYLKAQALSGLNDERVRERLIGRNEKGRTLVVPPEGEDPGNNFDYKGDTTGAKCPFSAHVRKTNPRTEGTPRIMRRSVPYGPDYNDKVPGSSEQDRGLMFMAYNASISQQYEVIQRWINGGNSTGTLSSRTDLLGGGEPSLAAGAPGQKPLIALCWGMYLFVPALDGLDFLAGERPLAEKKAAKAADREDGQALSVRAAHGKAVREKLEAIKDEAEARTAWKRLLEEDAYAEDADALWEYLAEKQRSIDTPYGWLIANLDEAQRILRDDGKEFSVREYWHRLRHVIGGHYLALDRAHPAADAQSTSKDVAFGERIDKRPSYDELANDPNQVIYESFTMESAYHLAHKAADHFLADSQTFDVRELARYVVAAIAQDWFDLPADAPMLSQTRKLLQNYVAISRYCFFPHPEKWQDEEVLQAGKTLLDEDKKVKVLKSAMALSLKAKGYTDDQDIRLAMRGALVGFVPATLAHIAGTIVRGFEQGELLALARTMADKPFAHVQRVLLGPVLKSITDHPVPTIVYRTAQAGSGYPKDTKVVIGLQAISRAAERQGGAHPAQWLFGGQSGDTAHGCPARAPATGILLGVLTAVARYAPLERESSLRFSHKVPVAKAPEKPPVESPDAPPPVRPDPSLLAVVGVLFMRLLEMVRS